MIETANPQPTVNSPQAGITANVAGFMSALAAYLHTRIELLQLEGKASAKNVAIAAACGVVSLVLLLFFWALLMVALGFIVYSPPPRWWLLILGVIAAHIVLVGALAGLVKAKVLTASVPTAAATLFLWTLLTGGFGIYLHMAFGNMGGVFLVLAAMHVFVAAALVLLATQCLGKVSLRTTLAELQKDREWLKNLKTQSLPGSN